MAGMRGVTVSAGYGAGGSVVAPAVAERLGLPLLDRAISAQVAADLHVSLEEAERGAPHRSWTDRFLTLLAPVSGGVLGAGTDAAPGPVTEHDDAEEFRSQAERVMQASMATGAVVLGRAGAAAMLAEPAVLRVRLHGTVEHRIAQGMRLGSVDEQTARGRQHQVDSARDHYVQRLYGRSADDTDLYQLQIDSTAIPLEACTDLIVAAFAALGSVSDLPG